MTQTPPHTPALRFPEFRGAGAWEVKKLKEVCEINPSTKKLPEDFFYIDLGAVNSGNLISKKKLHCDSAPSRAQRLLKSGDIIYQVVRPYQRNNFLCNFDDKDNYVASTGYAQLRALDSNNFLYQLIHTDSFVNIVISKCTGSNYPAISSSDLSEINISIPPLAEQEKIAGCLSSLDELITAHGDRLDGLKDYKRGLMQQLFPAKGQTTPTLRFPDFQGKDPWQEKRLGDQGDFLPSLTGKKGKDFDSGNAKFIPYLNVFNNTFVNEEVLRLVNVADGEKQNGVQKGDVFFTVSSETPEDAGMSSVLLKNIKNCYLNSFCAMFRFSLGKAPNLIFIGYLLRQSVIRSYFATRAQGMTRFNLSRDAFKNLPIYIPTPAEQQKIADCLSALDELITVQADKIETLKTYKKWLMQQLFPKL